MHEWVSLVSIICLKEFITEFESLQMMKKTRHPRWNEEFQFMLEEPPLHEKIHIEVMSKRKNFSFLSKVTTYKSYISSK